VKTPASRPESPSATTSRAPSARKEPAPRVETLRPPPAPATGLGTLVADSRPAGARVVLDGKAVGKTPLKLANVKAGAHMVRLELDGYRVWAAEITVAGGRDTRVAGSLERIRK
jgi:hypothetical protein